MTHSTEDLILAAHVRELAATLRNSDFSEADREWSATNDLTPMDHLNEKKTADHKESSRTFRREWYAARPLNGYVERALKVLSDMADEVQRLRG